MTLSELLFPTPSQLVFDRTVVGDWYDGLTSGIAQSSRLSASFRFDIVTWGPRQELRVFAFSPLAVRDFERIVELLREQAASSEQGQASWPIWFAKWPTWDLGSTPIKSEIGVLLSNASPPEYAVAADSMFETLFAARELDAVMRSSLPTIFDGQPVTSNFDDWRNFLSLP